MKATNNIEHGDYLTRFHDSLGKDINQLIKANSIKYIFTLLILINSFQNYFAQDFSYLADSRVKNNKLKISNNSSFYSNHPGFNRFFIRLNNSESLFDGRLFNDLKNYFGNEVVYYSINDKLNYDIISEDYATNQYKPSSKLQTLRMDDYYQTNFKFSNYLLQSDVFYNKFIYNVGKNQFFNNMYTKHNDIYTNEFNILDFQSVSAQQYWSGTKIWGSVCVGMLGALMLMPSSVTKWEEGYIDNAMENLNRAFTEPPVWDEDHWEINYIGHPVAGAFYYNTIRAQEGSILNSFLFSAFMSTGWEYVYEGVAERPSIQDLIVTPVAGAILGEVIHQTTLGMKKNGFSVFEAAFVTVFNPMYVILNGYK
ncbi:MAG: DUF3943 domain-containing protein [Bacteroidota bacterium]